MKAKWSIDKHSISTESQSYFKKSFYVSKLFSFFGGSEGNTGDEWLGGQYLLRSLESMYKNAEQVDILELKYKGRVQGRLFSWIRD